MLLYLSLLDTPEEKENFTQIYKRYQQLLWCAANDILRDPQLAEDAVQEAFLSLIRHMDCISAPFSPQTRNFLLTVVKRKAIDIYRRRSSRKEDFIDEDFELSSGEDTLDVCLLQESMEELKTAIRRLPQNHRTMLEYRYLHGLSEKQIACLLEIPSKRVNVAVFRARKKLQQQLEAN